MALKPFFDSADQVPEERKDDYVERDGKFVLDVEAQDGFALENVGGLKRILNDTRNQLQKARSQLEQFADLDPETAREALQKIEELDSGDTGKKQKEQLDHVRKQLSDKYEKEITDLKKERDDILKQLERHVIHAAAVKSIAEKKGSVELLLPVVERYSQMKRNDNGRYVAELVDEEGNSRWSDKNPGQPMDFDELIESMSRKDAYARAFEGTGATGSGAQSTSVRGSRNGNVVLSREEAKDPYKYRAAKQQAAERGAELVINE